MPPQASFGLLLWPPARALANQWSRADSARRGTYALFGALALGFWIGVYAVCHYFLRMFQGVELFGPLLVKKALSMLLLSFSGLLLFSNIVTALSSFFLSEDMQLVQSLPISTRRLFYYRFVDTLASSSWMVLIFGLPVLLAWGAVHGGGPLFYVVATFGLAAYAVPPAALGVTVASLLVRGVSARRLRDLLALLGGVMLIGLLLLLRSLRPEQLVDAQSFETLAEFIAAVRAPDISFLPSTWLVDSCLWALGQPDGLGLLALGLLFVTGPALLPIARWVTAPGWFEAWTKAQEAPPRTASRAQWVLSSLDAATAPLPDPFRTVLRKDLRLFLREPGQWTQGLLLLGLVSIYLYSVRSLPLEQMPIRQTVLGNVIAFLNVGVAGSVLAALAVRFHFIAVSQEGRAFWLLHSSPLGARRYLLSKFVIAVIPTFILGEILVLSTNALLRVEPFYAWIAASTVAQLSVGLCGLALGMGAIYPNFKADSAARMASGPAAILFMVLALSYVAAVIVIEAVPIGLILARQYRGQAVGPALGVALAASIAGTWLLSAYAAWLPMRRAAHKLWAEGGTVGD